MICRLDRGQGPGTHGAVHIHGLIIIENILQAPNHDFDTAANGHVKDNQGHGRRQVVASDRGPEILPIQFPGLVPSQLSRSFAVADGFQKVRRDAEIGRATRSSGLSEKPPSASNTTPRHLSKVAAIVRLPFSVCSFP